MKNVIVFSQHFKTENEPYVETLFSCLIKYNYAIHVNEDFFEKLNKTFQTKAQKLVRGQDLNAEAIITLGGDGTILSATKWLNKTSIPILGINLGRLGFLASIEKNSIKNAIDQWHNKYYSTGERALIRLDSNPQLFKDFPYALNDFTLHKKETSSMITIKAFIDDEYLNTYWADGIIVSTPTGSTGYSLSCGGPIVFPNSGNFIITPVAPHNLNVRPIVVPDNSKIRFELIGRSSSFLSTLDSRYETITKDYILTVQKADFSIKMIVLKGESFMKTIRDKLSWGLDKRN